MNIIKSIYRLLSGYTPNTGLLLDTRTQEEKKKDFRLEEIVAKANPVVWLEKPKDQVRTFPELDQKYTFSCVANTMKKLLLINYWLKTGKFLKLSYTHIYKRRANKPNPGMQGIDAFQIVKNYGVTLEELVPDVAKSDYEIDNTDIEPYKEEVGKVFKIDSYLQFAAKDLSLLASTIQTTGKGVMVWFYFTDDEWSREVPVVLDNTLTDPSNAKALRHSVTAVEPALYQGIRGVWIEDSAHFGGLNRRFVTESFYNARNYFAAYPMNFVFENQIDPKYSQPIVVPKEQKPVYQFTRTLKFTTDYSVSDPDVKVLQDILKYEGLFPTNVESTGIYGAITSKGVLAFQRKYQVAPSVELESLLGRVVGPKTIEKLNELYGI